MDPITAIALGALMTTAYQSVPEQTDSTPFYTSTGRRTNDTIAAVSRDLLWSGRACYGDWIMVEGIGFREVQDTMNSRYKNSIDIWVSSRANEKKVGKKPRGVQVLRMPKRDCRTDTIMRIKGDLL